MNWIVNNMDSQKKKKINNIRLIQNLTCVLKITKKFTPTFEFIK